MAKTPQHEMILHNAIFMIFIKNSVPSDERCYVNAGTNNAEMNNMLQEILTFAA